MNKKEGVILVMAVPPAPNAQSTMLKTRTPEYFLVVAASHELLGWRHGGHTHARAGDVVDRLGNVAQAGKVVVTRVGRVLLKGAKVIIFTLKIIFLVVAERLAVWAGLVSATMLGKVVRAREGLVAQWANVWSFLCVGAHVPLEVL